ncbi:uncharacterized protein LOC116257139 [Nymphaea colorata]|uniref:uncharacterized protein LOC116257139 n=1 Tax=Nymphaea colorata TaxID=210225 RepID=UPI00214E5DE1|nr:uncharacterized protein LOC116257139 [Nymphaea colorata]
MASGAGLSFKALMCPHFSLYEFLLCAQLLGFPFHLILFRAAELETMRILLDIFKERQQKNAEAGTIPSSFHKKKLEERFIGNRVWILAKYRFIKGVCGIVSAVSRYRCLQKFNRRV